VFTACVLVGTGLALASLYTYIKYDEFMVRLLSWWW